MQEQHLRSQHSQSQQAAVIVEPRNLETLLPLVIFNVSAVLGPDWPIYLFHGTENQALAAAIQQAEPPGHITLRNLGVPNLTIAAYSALLCSRAFWESVPTASHILVFQTDALLSETTPYRVSQFLEYDYVGAIWPHIQHPRVGNGGLSLRRKSAILQALAEKVPRAADEPEDLYFAKIFARNPRKYRVAPVQVAGKFSVERVLSDLRPFGVHAAHQKLKKSDWEKLLRYEPLFARLL